MKASGYHCEWADDPVIDKLAEYTETYPLEEDSLADIDWNTPEDEIFFYQDLEELAETDFSDEALESAFDGTMKVAHLVALLGIMEKNAKISTQAERVKSKQYRMAHKMQLARAARRRRRKEKSGMRRKMKRVGTAAGGYSFITSPTSGPKVSSTSNAASSPKAATHAPSGSGSYNPTGQTGSTMHRSTLKTPGL